jgi:hypothetical protein
MPGQMNGLQQLSSGDARQFGREAGTRLRDAQRLRDDLRRQGIKTDELDRAIDRMAKLEGAMSGNPLGLAQLQSDVIEGLKQFEFSLFKQLGVGSAKQPATGMRAQVSPEYSKAVDEYFKSIANLKKK